MPLPKPNDGESRDDFISRCAGSDAMLSEYPDNDQRVAVCVSQWDSAKKDNMDRADAIHLRLNEAATGDIHREMFDGEEHLVVPVVAAVEGVMNGEYVPVSSFSDSLPAWEGVSVTIAHPDQNGQDISANTKYALENFFVGRFFNAHIDGKKFKGEFWININKLLNHPDGEEILERIENGDVIDVSTSYWRRLVGGSGVHNGERYDGTAVDLVPNHIAILARERGACSVHDGCGTPRTNAGENDMAEGEKGFLERMRSKFATMMEETLKGLAQNRMSHGDVRMRVAEALDNNVKNAAYIHIVEMYDDEVVYAVENSVDYDINIFSRSFSIDDDQEVTLGDPTEVQQVVSYEPVGNSSPTIAEENMDRETIIGALASNEAVPFNHEQLSAMEDAGLEFLATNAGLDPETGEPLETEEVTEEPEGVQPEGAVEENQDADPAPETNAQGLSPEVVATLNKLGADGITKVVNSAEEISNNRKARKNKLVSMLVANERCMVKEASLRAMDEESLEDLARSFNVSYDGLGGPVSPETNRESAGPPKPPSLVLDAS